VEEMQRIQLMTEGRNDGIQQAFDAELSGREQLHERVPQKRYKFSRYLYEKLVQELSDRQTRCQPQQAKS
jgi:hypothetical protein